jgi:hypothetical protein
MAFIPLRVFLSIWHFKLIGPIGSRALSERVNDEKSCIEGITVEVSLVEVRS